MRAQTLFNAKPIVFDSILRLGAAGQTDVYALIQDANLAAKVLERPSVALARKLAFMVANPLTNLSDDARSFAVAWPVDLLLRAIENGTNVGGFIMPRASNSFSIVECYKAETRKGLFPAFTFRSMHKIARNLACAYKSLHSEENCQVRVGFVKEAHLLVSPSMQVSVVGTDCLQIRDMQANVMYKSMGSDLEFLAPELQGLSFSQFEFEKEHDYFGLAVLIFKLLMGGAHPFAGKGKDQHDTHLIAKRILTGQSVFGIKPEPGDVSAVGTLDPQLQDLFKQCFIAGHKDPSARPDAETWEKALDDVSKALTICQTQRQHVYGSHLKACPWCEMAKQDADSDPFPAREVEKRMELKDDDEESDVASRTLSADNNQSIRGANGNRQGASIPVIKIKATTPRTVPEKKKKLTKKELEADLDDGVTLFGKHFNISRTKFYLGIALAIIAVIALYTQLGSSSDVRATDVADASVSGVIDGKLASIDGKVVSMRFFESSDPEKHRIYQDRFQKAETRAISWEVGLEYPGQPEGTHLSLDAVWRDPDGAVIESQRGECPLSSSRSMSYYAFGYGREAAGTWPVGKYKVEVSFQGTKVAERTFEVY
jgi:hypothetical protein